MSKKGVSKVSGNTAPLIGEKQIYHIAEWYADTPARDRIEADVTWELFKKRKNGTFTSTHIKKKGIGEFTFGETARKHTYRLEAYLYKPEGGGLIIKPQPSTVPKINKVELCYVDDTKGSTFSFMEKLRAKAYCVNLTGEELIFTLWEDDAKGSGHHPENRPIEVSSPKKVGKNGVATAEFMLTKALMQKAMKGETDIRQIEFYVTAEYYKTKKHASENVDINNPFPEQKKRQNTQHPKHNTPTKAKGSPAEQKPKSKKEEKGFLDTALEMVGELWDFSESKGTATKDKKPTPQKPTGNKPVVVDHKNVEGNLENICPNCKKEITVEEITAIFGNDDKDFRMECIKWINKYKLHFNIDTCIKKAHFLSQIAAETHFKKQQMAEGSIKYTPKNIRSGIFGDRAKLLDRRKQIEEYCEQRPDQIKLFNFLYAKENGFGNGNGDEASGDGFNFRGKGLIQLTGKGNYKTAMAKIKEYVPSKLYEELLSVENRKKYYEKFTFSEGREEKTLKDVNLLDFITYYDMPTEPKYAVLSALADWRAKGLNNSPLMINDIKTVSLIRKKINSAGLNTDVAIIYFKKSIINLKVQECKAATKEKNTDDHINLYIIKIEKSSYFKKCENIENKKYQYDIYDDKKLIKSYVLEKNEHNLLPFPQSGPNWGRFGTRDKGGDNWINHKVCAALLGFFYSLPKNGFKETLYFNDISANDGRNIGHAGHNLAGNDIDIRYPGSSDGGQTFWKDAMKVYDTEEKFVSVLENIISIGVSWGFNKNYAYKTGIKNTTGIATSVHQDHFHLGLR